MQNIFWDVCPLAWEKPLLTQKVMSEGHIYILNSYEKVLLINLFFSSNSKLSYVVLQEDEENMNGNNIQEVMGEVEETAEESPFGPENMNENEEVDGIEVEFNTDATAMEGGLSSPKRGSKKAHHKGEISPN